MTILSDQNLQHLTSDVANHLLARDWMLVTAESCTGGWIAKCCTDIAGSSTWFDRGFVTYSNQAKQDMLDVRAETLEQFGAVSEQTIKEMAQGALKHSNANISIAISGIAGPDGGSDEKPIGTVWFAWAKDTSTITACHYFSGNRDQVRRQAVATALTGIIKNARA